jgi:putative transposase
MPGRNVLKSDASESFYHVYVRGGNKSRIFREDADYEMFLQLFARYLSLVEVKNSAGVSYPNYSNRVELLAFCLMPNHVHILLYQYSQHDMTEFMRSLLTSYSMYFNHKYKRTGPLFESRYKASLVSDDAYLHHISRYIHLNPRQWKEYPYSSLPYYLQQVSDDWIVPRRIAELFEGPTTYLQFLDDYVEHKEMLDILKHELANEI